MADLAPRSPLAADARDGGPALAEGRDVTLRERPRQARCLLRGTDRDALDAALAARLRCHLPAAPNRVGSGPHLDCLWLRPDAWLLVDDVRAPADLLAEVQAAIAGQFATAADVTDAWIGLALTGARAAEVLAAGCPLDLDPRAFPAGRSARTLLAQVPALLRPLPDAAGFEIHADASLARYLWDWFGSQLG